MLLCLQHGLTLERIAPFFNLSRRGLMRWIDQGKKGNKSYMLFYTAYNYGKALKHIHSTLNIYEEMKDQDFEKNVVFYESMKTIKTIIVETALEQMNLSADDYFNYFNEIKSRLNHI